MHTLWVVAIRNLHSINITRFITLAKGPILGLGVTFYAKIPPRVRTLLFGMTTASAKHSLGQMQRTHLSVFGQVVWGHVLAAGRCDPQSAYYKTTRFITLAKGPILEVSATFNAKIPPRVRTLLFGMTTASAKHSLGQMQRTHLSVFGQVV